MSVMTPEQEAFVADVRRMAQEPTTETYTDDAILALVVGKGSVAAAVVAIWQEKAGKYAHLVNVSESGSSRSLSDLHKNAIAMAKYYETQLPGVAEAAAEVDYPFTADITRA